MTHAELAQRKPLWEAMADLFLDTEVRFSVPFVARRCVESGCDDEALERIFWAEVFPEALPNLLSPTGEWMALTLDEAALIKRANAGTVPWLSRRAHGWMVQGPWLAVREVAGWLRACDQAEREQRCWALELLGRRYFETPGRESTLATREKLAEVLAVAREEWGRYEAVCRRLRGDDEAPHDVCAAEVAALLR
jgi:hypothetical protein